MLNKESQNYFNRAFASSGAALIFFVLHKANHVELLKKYTGIYDTKALIDYLKIADEYVLRTISPFDSKLGSLLTTWVPTIERANIKGAFLTKTPEEIYNSSEAPVMDTMFTFNTQVTSFKIIFYCYAA